MTIKRLPVVHVLEQDRSLPIDITAALGSAGQAIAETRATNWVQLINLTGTTSIEYRVGAGDWVSLDPTETVDLDIDLSQTTIYLRRGGRIGLPAKAQIFFELVDTPPGRSTDRWYDDPDATPLVVSTSDPVDDDNRPDGTIWIKVG